MEYYLLNIKDENMVKVDKLEVLDKLYYMECTVPSEENIKKNIKNHDLEKHIMIFLKSDIPKNIINKIKKDISQIEDKIPLYDIYTENIYLIGKYNVYDRVIHQFYRFPDFEFLGDIKKKLDKFNKNENITDKLQLRKKNKLVLMIDFMNCFDIDILYDTYIKIFYKYSEMAGKSTTTCVNMAFLPQLYHIAPYLNKSEVINSALNYGVPIDKKILEQSDINKLCKIIKKYQFTSDILLQHQTYIMESGYLGLVQYYTLQGSFFMNQYLRNMTTYSHKNQYLESLIEPMWKLVLNAPAFDKQYTLYRFIKRDEHLQHLAIGDMYLDNSFVSTTRNMFYKADEYGFGFILIKINIPAKIKGIALCLELISHFPYEEEFIFPPNSSFELVAKDDNCDYYHTDPYFASKLKTRYEFVWRSNGKIMFDRNEQLHKKDSKESVDFLKINKITTMTLGEKIKYFENNYVNEMYQFEVDLGKKLTLMTEIYDSANIYKKYYAIETKNGYAMYTLYKNYVLFFIEIGETDDGIEMHVNYYTKYSSVDPSKEIGDEKLITFFSSIAHFFDISNIIMYSNYLNCSAGTLLSYNMKGGVYSSSHVRQRGFSGQNTQIKNDNDHDENVNKYDLNMLIGSYNVDIYQYMTTGIKKYSDIGVLNVELKPKFSYYDLDMLKNISPSKILAKEDRDEIYQLYDKIYDKKNDNLAEFYKWLKEHKCYLLDQYVAKIDRIMRINPFKNDYYILDGGTYLYNRKYIKSYPMYGSIKENIKRNILKENKNDYRTRKS
jgi:hypothetical protein